MIGLLRSRRFATAGKALLLACYGQFKLTVASQSSGLIMYIFTTLEFPTRNIDFHLLTASVNAKYYY